MSNLLFYPCIGFQRFFDFNFLECQYAFATAMAANRILKHCASRAIEKENILDSVFRIFKIKNDRR